ncbi:uncharacterized protein LOC141909846 [Tubulanus polymorphus]|uniref:uncharacterized protein LOC141909846 n=1 Tax=Tubulanus polymorphus TaxID=672921 RepID=UPI003DA54E15
MGDSKATTDLSRPPFNREKGQIGVYIDIQDVQPIDRQEYGSERFMFISLTEKLLENFQNVPLLDLKADLVRHGLLEGVVLEKYIPGIILTVSCNTSRDLDELWDAYNKGPLAARLKTQLETKSIKQAIKVTSLDLRIRLFEDEYKQCKSELQKHGVIVKNLANYEQDVKMLRAIRKFQKDNTKSLYKLRDDKHQFDAKLGEFIQLAKTYQPPGTIVYKSVLDVNSIKRVAKETRATVDIRVLDQYLNTVKNVLKSCDDLTANIVHPFSQIHAGCESENQRDLKQSIKQALADVRALLRDRADISNTKHSNWVGKVLPMERKLLLGIVCVIPCAIEKVIDVDHSIDEYFREVKVDLGD